MFQQLFMITDICQVIDHDPGLPVVTSLPMIHKITAFYYSAVYIKKPFNSGGGEGWGGRFFPVVLFGEVLEAKKARVSHSTLLFWLLWV